MSETKVDKILEQAKKARRGREDVDLKTSPKRKQDRPLASDCCCCLQASARATERATSPSAGSQLNKKGQGGIFMTALDNLEEVSTRPSATSPPLGRIASLPPAWWLRGSCSPTSLLPPTETKDDLQALHRLERVRRHAWGRRGDEGDDRDLRGVQVSVHDIQIVASILPRRSLHPLAPDSHLRKDGEDPVLPHALRRLSAAAGGRR